MAEILKSHADLFDDGSGQPAADGMLLSPEDTKKALDQFKWEFLKEYLRLVHGAYSDKPKRRSWLKK